MKSSIRTILLTLLVTALTGSVQGQSAKDDSLLVIATHFRDGYGAFKSGMGSVGFDDGRGDSPWSKCFPKVRGVPEAWTNVKRGMIWLDTRQFVYQNWKNGNISDEWYNKLKQTWKWEPNEMDFSSNPIQSAVSIFVGNDSGITKALVDTDNDGDLSDETPFVPPVADFANLDRQALENLFRIKYQLFIEGKIIDRDIPLFIAQENGMIMYNFPTYATGKVQSSNFRVEVSFFGFVDGSFRQPQVTVIDTTNMVTDKVDPGHILNEGQVVKIGNETYRFENFIRKNNSLIMRRLNGSKLVHSPQVNHLAFPFAANDIVYKKQVSLGDLRGKWVLLDFWGSWCAPCIKELPALRALYQKIDKSKVEFIGIAGQDRPAALLKAIEKYEITWPQILSDTMNMIVEKYQIESYPTTFLINPEGVIVEKNLLGKRLENVLSELGTSPGK